MKIFIIIFSIFFSVLAFGEDIKFDLGESSKKPFEPGETLNPCYLVKGRAFSKYYKFAYSKDGKVTKYLSPEDEKGIEHPGKFTTFADFINTAGGGGGFKSGLEPVGVCTFATYELDMQKRNIEFKKAVERDINSCTCNDGCAILIEDVVKAYRKVKGVYLCSKIRFGFCLADENAAVFEKEFERLKEKAQRMCPKEQPQQEKEQSKSAS